MTWAVSGNIKGPIGATGATGATGADGAPGADGAGIEIAGDVATYGDLPSGLGSGDSGKGYLVDADGKLYIWSGSAFPANGDGVEFQGPAGTAATVVVGSVTELSAGDTPTVSNSGSSSAAVLDFGIPPGAKGDTGATGSTGSTGSDGAAATIAVGAVTSLSAGSTPTVTNLGSSSAAVFAFGIPAGATGSTGSTGSSGARGSNWYVGTGAPGSITGSQAGDQYLDSTSGDVYTLG